MFFLRGEILLMVQKSGYSNHLGGNLTHINNEIFTISTGEVGGLSTNIYDGFYDHPNGGLVVWSDF